MEFENAHVVYFTQLRQPSMPNNPTTL